MAKKAAPAPKKPTAEHNQLVEAIATVKHLQDFISEHGGVEKAMEAVCRVYGLISLTGGIDQLKQALSIVGGEAAPAAEEQAPVEA